MPLLFHDFLSQSGDTLRGELLEEGIQFVAVVDFFLSPGVENAVNVRFPLLSLGGGTAGPDVYKRQAYGWLRENGMTWEDYWDAFRDYNHALYITNLSKTEPEKLVELNYQFLSTLSIQPEELRPADLPEGWDHSPENDPRQWLTKATETAY